VWTKIGQCLKDSSSHCPSPVEHLVMIFIFFVEGGRGWGGGVGGLRKMKRNPPPTPSRPLLPKFKRNKSKAP